MRIVFQRLLHAISRNFTACVRAFRKLNNITATAKQIEDECRKSKTFQIISYYIIVSKRKVM